MAIQSRKKDSVYPVVKEIQAKTTHIFLANQINKNLKNKPVVLSIDQDADTRTHMRTAGGDG